MLILSNLKMDIPFDGTYEADSEEIVRELLQGGVIRQTYTLLLTRFWFHRDFGSFSFFLMARIIP